MLICKKTKGKVSADIVKIKHFILVLVCKARLFVSYKKNKNLAAHKYTQ